jgi:eukaryotic-like serine/threonine-protein kinase
LQAYTLGLQAVAAKGEEASIPFFRRAVELDPKFAMAYAYLSLEYGSSGSTELATENIRKAYELAAHVSDNERFFISAYYYGRAVGNQEKARQICEQWAQTYPRDPLPHAFLAGFIFPVLANFDKGLEEARKGMGIAPDQSNFYMELCAESWSAGRRQEAEEALQLASQRNLETPILLVVAYDLGFLTHNHDRMQRAVNAIHGNMDASDWMADAQAFAFAYGGQLKEARVLSRQATELAQQQGDHERAAEFTIKSALREAFFGDGREAKEAVADALALANNREIQYATAVVAALTGDSKQAQALANHLESDFPEDTSVRFSYLPVIHAIVALSHNDPPRAIAALEPAFPYELGAPRCSVVMFFGALYPVLLRGQAYLAGHKGPEAAQEYQKLLDHSGPMIGDPVQVLAHLGLARSYALSGDATKARDQYEELLALWKDADPDLPVLHQAKTELARLQVSR